MKITTSLLSDLALTLGAMAQTLGCLAALILYISISPAAAATITLNFATGQDAYGNIQSSGGSLDANWHSEGGVAPIVPGSAYVVDQNSADWSAGWFGNSGGSSFIAVNPYDARGNGVFSLTYTFDLTGYDLSTAVFSGGKWAIDDAGSLILNGNTLGSLIPGQWGVLSDFTISTANLVPGINKLKIQMDYADAYLEAACLDGKLTVSSVPLPAALPLFLTGLGLLGRVSHRRKKA
jgi:hypothetical protein